MYVLFDDGRTLHRKLRYENTDPDGTKNTDPDDEKKYLGKYDPNSEAHRFFAPIDNVWGDYKKRDEEEDKYVYHGLIDGTITVEKKKGLSYAKKFIAQQRKADFDNPHSDAHKFFATKGWGGYETKEAAEDNYVYSSLIDGAITDEAKNALSDDEKRIAQQRKADFDNSKSEAGKFFMTDGWGGYETKKAAEDNYVYSSLIDGAITVGKKKGLSYAKKFIAQQRKREFNERYYLKYADGRVVDIANIPSAVLESPKVIGIAFTIFRKEYFEDLPKRKKGGETINRQKISTFYLEKKIAIKEEDRGNYQDLATITALTLIENSDYKTYPKHEGDVTTYQLGPTLVLNKETILKNRNYIGNLWNNPPANWDRMLLENPNNWGLIRRIEDEKGKTTVAMANSIELTFNPEKYWGFDPAQAKRRLIIRLGREGSKYVLFLHGDKEGGCPIRIPQE